MYKATGGYDARGRRAVTAMPQTKDRAGVQHLEVRGINAPKTEQQNPCKGVQMWGALFVDTFCEPASALHAGNDCGTLAWHSWGIGLAL